MAYDEGIRHFGENYIDELNQKYEAMKLSHPDILWHYVGYIESKKAKNLVQC